MAGPITLGMMALTAAGTAVSAAGTLAAGDAAQQSAQFKSQQENQAAQESRASSQRAAIESRRKGGLMLSTLQARAAASGGGADDPTVLNLAGGIAGRSEYDALTEMFKGENRARGYEDQAKATLFEGDSKKSASQLSALGTIIGGAGSMYGQYNKLPPRVAYG